MTPRSDVCHYCEDYHTAIQCAVSETDKATYLAEFGKHVEDAQKEHNAYIAAIEESKRAIATNSEPNFGHFTFDFAQQVFLPYHSRQVGPLYYKVPLRVQIFGFVMTRSPFK